jgi:2-alkyl-3-oxoalkanoate reductase
LAHGACTGVYGPGDRETLAYFKAVARGLAPRPRVADARLSLIHVADLAEALALALDQPPPPSTYEIDDGRDGGYSYRDMADAAGRALGRRPLSLAVPRWVMAAIAELNAIGHSLGGSVQILTPGKVGEIFHSDWRAHDQRLATALGFRPRFDLATGFGETILWYRRQGWL